MDRSFLVGGLLLTGLVAIPVLSFGDLTQTSKIGHNHGSHSHEDGNISGSSDGLVLGSSHEHALFFVDFNGSEVDFTGKRFQVRSRYVHLENFKPHIVHKHSENVTWNYFLNTIDVGVEDDCVQFKESKQCGNVSMILNGKELEALNKEIEQDDNLAIITPSNQSKRESYMEKELPKDYRKEVEKRTL
jgi:hypothetical protein